MTEEISVTTPFFFRDRTPPRTGLAGAVGFPCGFRGRSLPRFSKFFSGHDRGSWRRIVPRCQLCRNRLWSCLCLKAAPRRAGPLPRLGGCDRPRSFGRRGQPSCSAHQERDAAAGAPKSIPSQRSAPIVVRAGRGLIAVKFPPAAGNAPGGAWKRSSSMVRPIRSGHWRGISPGPATRSCRRFQEATCSFRHPRSLAYFRSDYHGRIGRLQE
jgi:hypothetical protein